MADLSAYEQVVRRGKHAVHLPASALRFPSYKGSYPTRERTQRVRTPSLLSVCEDLEYQPLLPQLSAHAEENPVAFALPDTPVC